MARQVAVSDEVRQIDQQIQNLIEQKAKLELEKLIPLRKQYLDVLAEIGKAVAPHGLTAPKYLAMSPEQAEKFILDRSYEAHTGSAPVPRRKMKVPPKYRHPRKKELTWTGRGNQPIWVREYLEKGGTLEKLLIDPTASTKKSARKKAAK